MAEGEYDNLTSTGQQYDTPQFFNPSEYVNRPVPQRAIAGFDNPLYEQTGEIPGPDPATYGELETMPSAGEPAESRPFVQRAVSNPIYGQPGAQPPPAQVPGEKDDKITPEYKITELRDGVFVEVIPKGQFILSIIIVITLLATASFLFYAVYEYDQRKNRTLQETDKTYLQQIYDGSIGCLVILIVLVGIFCYFYFKNFNKKAWAQDDASIRNAFKLISRQVAQHAADQYSDRAVDAHMDDMETLGGRINEARRGGNFMSAQEYKERFRGPY